MKSDHYISKIMNELQRNKNKNSRFQSINSMMSILPINEHLQNQQPPSPNLISVYLRRTDKNGIKIQLPLQIMLWELQHLIALNVGVPEHRQILYIKSHKYFQTYNQILTLQPNCIIHVHEKIRELPNIKIYIQALQKDEGTGNVGTLQPAEEFTVHKEQEIEQFLKQNLMQKIGGTSPGEKQIFLVESGRIVDISQTFEEAEIVEGACLTLQVNSKKGAKDTTVGRNGENEGENVKSNEVQEDLMKLFDDEDDEVIVNSHAKVDVDNSRKKQESQSLTYEFIPKPLPLKKKEQPKSRYQRVFIDPKQYLEESSDDYYEEKKNFKKKQVACYKAVDLNSENAMKDYIWKRINEPLESESLLRCIKKKKNSTASTKKPDSFSSEKLSQSTKLTLRAQFKKLFQNESNGLRKTFSCITPSKRYEDHSEEEQGNIFSFKERKAKNSAQ